MRTLAPLLPPRSCPSPRGRRRGARGVFAAILAAGAALVGIVDDAAAATIQRTRFQLPSANGHTALLVDLEEARVVQLREHLFAAEEPQLDGQGQEIWNGSDFAGVYTRDLLYDAYFGVRVGGENSWLTGAPVDLDASGYLGWKDGTRGGTGVVAMVQQFGDLEVTTYAFAPMALGHVGAVLALKVRNTGGSPLAGVQAFSIHNLHLGFGRAQAPWDVGVDIGENGETLLWDQGKSEFTERGFAGVVVMRPLATVSHHGAAPGADVFGIVDKGGAQDLPDNTQNQTVDGAVSAYQFDLGALQPGAEKWVGVALTRHASPFEDVTARGWLDAYLGGKQAKALVDAELAAWASFQQGLTLPSGLSADDEVVLRHSAAMLRMGQVQEETAFLREWLSKDGEPRRTRFPGVDNLPTELPALVKHRGKGAILASLPPGNWTYAWIRDGAYAATAMATLGMKKESRDALEFYLNAEAGRFKEWQELASYGIPDYQISLVRYYGFGVEETDFNEFGPNLEFDGFGLFLWALHAYESLSGDETLTDMHWPVIRDRIADVLVALVDPETGLLRADSSIWETHWEGRERHYAYTSITAARGLCDAAALAARVGDAAKAELYADTAASIRQAIADHLTDGGGAIAANLEELAAGEGYYDAAVWDAIAMGLFDPAGAHASATAAALDGHLQVAAGPGWSRNDDRSDHPMSEDLSPWGSDYDSAEWVITDLRGSIAARMRGEDGRADELLAWVRDQALANYLMVAETFDESTGVYKFNTPMLGFGAGALALAMVHRGGGFGSDDPACGAYLDEGEGTTTTGGDETTGDPSGTTGDPTASGTSGGESASGSTSVDPSITDGVSASGNTEGAGISATSGGGGDDSGCGCRGGAPGPGGLLGLVLVGLAGGRRRRPRGRG
ncbi:MAG: glycoside hydrolase family 15 protein [Nannocystaceae bacterium]